MVEENRDAFDVILTLNESHRNNLVSEFFESFTWLIFFYWNILNSEQLPSLLILSSVDAALNFSFDRERFTRVRFLHIYRVKYCFDILIRFFHLAQDLKLSLNYRLFLFFFC